MTDFTKIAQTAMALAQATAQTLNAQGVSNPTVDAALAIGQTVLGTIETILPAVQGLPESEQLRKERDDLRAAIDKQSEDEETALRG